MISGLDIPDLIDGRYRVDALLGHGGMGAVLKVRDHLMDRSVALKVLSLPGGVSERALLHFQQEFAALRRLKHPNVPQVYDYGEVHPGLPYFTMELVEGVDLSQMLPLPIHRFYPVVIQLAQTLAFVHSRRVVHRDIKTTNVRVQLDDEGRLRRVILLDFGLVSPFDAGGGRVVGTLSHLPPEAFHGGELGVRSDLYSLGVLMFECLTGQLPRVSRPRVGATQRVTSTYLDLSLVAGYPAPLSRLLRSMLAASPSMRPGQADAVVEVLERLSGSNAQDLSEEQKRSYLASPALVGRVREMQALRDAEQRSRDGQTEVVLLSAIAGEGKTRLLDEFTLEVQVSGARVVRAVCPPDARTPFGPVMDALAPLLAMSVAREDPALMEVAPHLVRASETLGRLLPHVRPSAPLPDKDADLVRLLDSLESWLRAVSAEQLLLLVLDDIQWADSHSIDFINRVLERRGAAFPILLVGAMRSDELDQAPGLKALLAQHPGVDVRLGPFDRHAVRELLRKQFAVEEPPDELIAVLLAETGGNPYFLHETLRFLVDKGLIRYLRGEWLLPERVEDLRLPSVLSAIVSARLARCAADAQDAAFVLAVAGRAVESVLLRKLVTSERALGELVQDLLDQDIVAWDGDSLRLAHAFMMDRLRQDLDPVRAAELHRRLAEAMLSLRDEDPGRYNEAEIGRHLQLAGRLDQALPLLMAAGKRAHDLQAQEEAIRILGWATEILATRPYVPGGPLDQTELTILRLLFTLDPAACTAMSERMMKRMLAVGYLGRIYSWRGWLGSLAIKLAVLLSLPTLRKEHPGFPTTQLKSFYGFLVLSAVFRTVSVGWTGRFKDAQTINAAEVLPLIPGDRPELAALCDAGLCVVLTQQGRTQDAYRRLDAVKATLEGPAGESVSPAERHLAIFGAVLIALGVMDATRGLPTSLDRVRGPGAADNPHHSLFLEASTVLVSSLHHGLRGELAQLEQELARLRQMRVTLRPQSLEIMTRSLIWASIEAGHYDRARSLLDELRHMGGFSEALRALMLARLPGAQIDRLRNVDRARTLARDPQIDSPWLAQVAEWVEAEVRIGGGQPRQAISRLETALRSAQEARTRNEYNEMVSLRLMAESHLAMGDLAAARDAAQRALTLAQSLQNPIQTGLCQVVLAQIVAEPDPDLTEELLQSAVGLFERLGNDHLLRVTLDVQRRFSQLSTISSLVGVAPALDPHHLSHQQIARLGWSLDLGEVSDGILSVLGDMVDGARRWVYVAATTDTGELFLGQDPNGVAMSSPGALPDGVIDRLRSTQRKDLGVERLPDSDIWVFPLTRPTAPGAGQSPGPAFGWVLVQTPSSPTVSEASMRELAPRVRAMAGFLNNALEHARLAQREYRLSMVNQLSQLLGSVRSGAQIISLVLDRMVDIVGADRAAMLLLDDRSGELRLEMVRDIGRRTLSPEGLSLDEEMIERALTDTGVLQVPDTPSRLLAATSLEPPRCHGVLVPLRSLLRELEGMPEEVERRQESLMTLSLPELTTIAQSDAGGQAVGLVWLEIDRRPEGHGVVDEPLLTMLASQSGLALDVARLDRQLEQEIRQQEALKAQRAQLERYLSKEVAQAVLADPDLVSLGARKAVVTVVFTDVRGFTQWSESMPSDKVVSTLNAIFSIITPILFQRGGTLDKYLGDGLMAIFGAPVERPDHALHAVLAAREMLEALNAWSQGQIQAGNRIPGMGIGIHTGEVSVGNIGSPERMEYTAIGDVVNVGSRICGLAGPGQVLISERTLAAMPIGAFLTRKLELVQVKGRRDPVQLFEIL